MRARHVRSICVVSGALLTALATVLSVTALAASHGARPRTAISAADAIAQLNALRGANGIPANITELPDYSAKCQLANNYNNVNNTLTHQEDPTKPGYTAGGADAASKAVLASGSTSWSAANPWLHAPIHLDQLLAPRLTGVGAAELETTRDWGGGPQPFFYDCATTWPGMSGTTSVTTPTTYTYPGNGRTGVDYAETTRESPFTPGDIVGLPQPTTTGPNLYVFADQPNSDAFSLGMQITAAAMTGPGGAAVPIKWVDESTAQIGPYLVGGIIIPVSPLAQNTAYSVSVTYKTRSYDFAANAWVYNGTPVTYTWSFTTGNAAPPGPAPQLFHYESPSFAVPLRDRPRVSAVRSCGRDLIALGAAVSHNAGGSVVSSTPVGQHSWQVVLSNPAGSDTRARLTLVCLSLTGQGHRLILGPLRHTRKLTAPPCLAGEIPVQVGFGPGGTTDSCLAKTTTISSGHYHRLILAQPTRAVQLRGGSRAVRLRCPTTTRPVVGGLAARGRDVQVLSSLRAGNGWRFELGGIGPVTLRLLCLSSQSTGEIYLHGSAGAGDASPAPPGP